MHVDSVVRSGYMLRVVLCGSESKGAFSRGRLRAHRVTNASSLRTPGAGYLPRACAPARVPQHLRNWAWCCKPAVPALERWRQEGQNFKAILGYRESLRLSSISKQPIKKNPKDMHVLSYGD